MFSRAQRELLTKMPENGEGIKQLEVGETEPLHYSTEDACPAALQTDVVLRQVFGYLKYEDIKACRMICTKWRNITQPFFEKKSRILLLIKKSVEDSKNPAVLAQRLDQLMKDFHSILSNMPQSQTSAAIGLRCTSAIPMLLYENVLQSEVKNHITDLKLNHVYLTDGNGKWITNYEIKRLIGDRNLYLTSLYISSGQFCISPKDIPMIENLTLFESTIILDGMKISPKKIILNGVKFRLENKEKSSNTRVNDFINFERVQMIEFEGCTTIADENIVIDMSQSGISVDSVSFNDMKIDWKATKWEIRKMILFDVSFLEKTEAKITELHVNSLDDEEIDLSVLPKSLELLNLHEKPMWSSSIVLPNLKHLILWDANCLNVVPFLQECTNFELLEIVNGPTSSNYVNHSITTIYGTKTVKKCKIHYIFGWNKAATNFQFQTMVVNCQLLSQRGEKYVTKITHDLVILSGDFIIKKNEEAGGDHSLYLINYININKSTKIAIGCIQWEEGVGSEHPLLSYVDKKAEYYLIGTRNEKKPGKAINRFQFDQLSLFAFGKKEILHFLN